ncbi:MAG: hypothetical protein HY006_00075, partial [Candidatus Sungbacteria bacterium]|nr:hypothetical protein [Candidatus Sungbacteria bacterium]
MPLGGSTSLFQFFETVQSFRSFLLDLWWFWLFLFLFVAARSLWLAYIREHYQRSTKWVLLELKIPREVRKAPRAMEQVFMSIHTVRNSPNNIKEKWWDGEVTLWCSCEVVSFGGDIHFYLRVPERNRNIIEASLYSQYQDI